MKKYVFLFLAAFWVVEYTRIEAVPTYIDKRDGCEMFPVVGERKFNSIQDAAAFIEKMKKDPYTSNMKIYRMEERNLPMRPLPAHGDNR